MPKFIFKSKVRKLDGKWPNLWRRESCYVKHATRDGGGMSWYKWANYGRYQWVHFDGLGKARWRPNYPTCKAFGTWITKVLKAIRWKPEIRGSVTITTTCHSYGARSN